jgi:peroxiredoxin
LATFSLGSKVPNFELPSASGEQYSFDSYRNDHKGWHLIVFFRGAWCSVCVGDLTDLEKNKGYFEDKNVYFTTITTDNLNNLKKMVEDHALTYPVLADEDLKVLQAFDVFYHSENDPYEDHGSHGEPAYFLTDENANEKYSDESGPIRNDYIRTACTRKPLSSEKLKLRLTFHLYIHL